MSSSRGAAAGLLLATLACSPAREPTPCRTAAECPPASRCSAGVCRAAARPVAALAPLEPFETFALVTLDGSASRDPDGGGIVAHRWRVDAVDAPCDAPAVAGTEALARVRFGCPGRYAVSLVVVNDLRLESEPLTTTVSALAPTDVPVVSAGPDLVRDHACAGTPLRCTTTEPVALAARSSRAGLSLRWSVQPPVGRPLSDARRARFVPDAASLEPALVIESDGPGLAGEWIVDVEARDEHGVVGRAFTRVTVTNRPPVLLVRTPLSIVPHAFDAARSAFTAAGRLELAPSDPDGDPLHVEATWRHVGDGGATFAGKVSPWLVTFAVEVPYAIPADALKLRGGEGLLRVLELAARDDNGGESRVELPIEIGNRPPVRVSAPASLTVPHRFDAVEQRYVASAQLGTWRDPDGDPLEPSGGIAPCDDLSILDGIVTVTCSVPYRGAPAVGELAGRREVALQVRDPWEAAAGAGTVALEVQNSAPTLETVTDPAMFYGKWDQCPPSALRMMTVPAGWFTVTPTVNDPDGDPVSLRAAQRLAGATAEPPEQVCYAATCSPVRFFEPEQTFRWPCSQQRLYCAPSSVVASDGVFTVSREVDPWPHTVCPEPPPSE